MTSKRSKRQLKGIFGAALVALAWAAQQLAAFVPGPETSPRPLRTRAPRTSLEVLRQGRQPAASQRSKLCPASALKEVSEALHPGAWLCLAAAALGLVGAWEALGGPLRLSAVWVTISDHHASLAEDVFLCTVLAVTAYCLSQMASMQMRCSHWEARIHTGCNAIATLLSVYGVAAERLGRESPGLWWAVLTPLFYLVSNFTMTRLMKMYRGPEAYKHLFDLGQSFTLSFQGIHCLAWSSVYPELYWLALPFWYWSLKKLIECVTYFKGILATDAEELRDHRARGGATWGAFGLELDAITVTFALVNFAAALADNAYMGTFTLRGPDGFFEVSRSLADSSQAGWGSDHLRMALVKPALGSLVVSMSVFIGTLVSRQLLPFAVGVPISVLLSSVGPWLVFFWHRLVDPNEPWLPEIMGDSAWGPF